MHAAVSAYLLPDGIIPAATALFFGLCLSAFLPMHVGALFTRKITKAGVMAGMCAGCWSAHSGYCSSKWSKPSILPFWRRGCWDAILCWGSYH
jgi:Na+/proline symporter